MISRRALFGFVAGAIGSAALLFPRTPVLFRLAVRARKYAGDEVAQLSKFMTDANAAVDNLPWIEDAAPLKVRMKLPLVVWRPLLKETKH